MFCRYKIFYVLEELLGLFSDLYLLLAQPTSADGTCLGAGDRVERGLVVAKAALRALAGDLVFAHVGRELSLFISSVQNSGATSGTCSRTKSEKLVGDEHERQPSILEGLPAQK